MSEIDDVHMAKISPVKREKIKKELRNKRRLELRANLPVLTKEQIRRHRLQYHDALILDLQEQGYPSSADYLVQLIEYQDHLRTEHGPDTKVWNRPQLIKCKEELDRLFCSLRKAEKAHYEEKYAAECDEILRLGTHYTMGPEDWWWLGEQLLIQSIEICSSYTADGGKREALSNYIYGKFMLENLRDDLHAEHYLKLAREISMGKSWTAKIELGPDQHTIFTESSVLICKALLMQAKKIMDTHPQYAASICTIARKRALDACDHNSEADCLMLQGLCHIRCNDYYPASESFVKALQIRLRANDVIGICEARIQLAITYLQTDRCVKALEQLEILHQFAEDNNLPFYVGRAHRYFGDYYLSQGKPSYATPFLIKALNIFHEIGEELNREQARNLAAISAGLELMPNYKDLILKSGLPGKIGKEHLIKLILWKDSRELFLSQSHNDISELSKHSFLQMKDAEMGSTVFKFDQEESIEISTFTIEDSVN